MFVKKTFLYILLLVFLYSCEDNRKESQANTAYVDTFSVMKQYDQAKIIEEKYDALLKNKGLATNATVDKSTQEYYNKLENRKKAALDSLNKDVNKIIYEYAHNNGYDNVYGATDDTTAFKGKKNDITQEIIILLNSQISTADRDAANKIESKVAASVVPSTKVKVQKENSATDQAAIDEAKRISVAKRAAYLKRVEEKKQQAILAVKDLEVESARKEEELNATKTKLQDAKNNLDNLVISDASDLDNIVFDSDSVVNNAIKNELRDSIAIRPIVLKADDLKATASALMNKNSATVGANTILSNASNAASTEKNKVSALNPADKAETVTVMPVALTTTADKSKTADAIKSVTKPVNEIPVSPVYDQKEAIKMATEVPVVSKSAEVDAEDSSASISSLLEILDDFTANQNFLSKSLDSIAGIFEKDNANKLLIIQDGSKENQFFDTVSQQIIAKNADQNALLNKFERMYDEVLKQESTQTANNLYLNTLNKLNADQKNIEELYVNLFDKVNDYKTEAVVANQLRIENATAFNIEQQKIADKEKLEFLKRTVANASTGNATQKYDFGYQFANMQVVKNIENVESGFYLILAVHNDSKKAETFMKQALASGQKNIKFFYNLNLNSYFIYTDKFDTAAKGVTALENKTDVACNAKMVLIKIEK